VAGARSTGRKSGRRLSLNAVGVVRLRLQLSVDRYGAFPHSLRIVEPLLAFI
jgi:hypothetical protein